MNKKILFLFFSFALALSAGAQEVATDDEAAAADTSIVQSLTRPSGGAQVVVTQDSVLDVRLSRNSGSLKVNEEGHIFTQGYRIQVFSDNRRNAREEADVRSQYIAESDTLIPVYVTYLSPFWRLRIGDYRTYEEAFIQMQAIKKQFPRYASEMRIVKDEIVLPLSAQ